MTPTRRQMVERARRLAEDREVHPLRYMRWTPPQMAMLLCSDRYAVLTLGQQLGGKTTVGLADTIWRCIGEHPYQTLPPRPAEPFQAWVVCYSHAQSLQIQAKLWELLPKDRLHPDTEFKGLAGGFRGKYPSVRIKDVDGRWATIMFKTTKQGPEALASGTVHHIQVDEPTDANCWQEIKGRVRRTAGTIRGTLTPINAPTQYLQDEVAAGVVTRLRFDLTQANATPEGSDRPLSLGDGTPITDDWIARERAQTPAAIVGVVLDGHWESRGVARYFAPFVADPHVAGSHVSTEAPIGEVELRLGIDHGDRPGKQIVQLVAVARDMTRRGGIYADHTARVWVVDEYTDESGLAGPADDARGILDMLSRSGMQWHQLAHAMGDRIHLPGQQREKSNRDLMKHLALLLKVPPQALRPQIKTVRKSRGGRKDYVGTGARWLFQSMAAPGGFRIHPRCVRTIAAINEWTGPGPDCDEKDPIDALRYALEDLIWGGIKPVAVEIVTR